MATRTRSLAVLTAMVFGVASVALGAGAGGTTTRRGSRNSDRKPSRYYVTQVITAEAECKFETVGNTDYRDKEKEYEEEYKQNLLEWAKAKREAQKADQEFDQKKPAGPRILRRMPKSFKEETDAQEYADKLQQAWDEALAKKRAKEEGGGEDVLKDDKGKDEPDKNHKKEE